MKTYKNKIAALIVLFLVFVNGYGQTEQIFFDDFETSKGWVRNAYGTDYATTGLWERDVPEATVYGSIMQLGTTVSGTRCLVTGRLAGSGPGSYDIDGGKTTMRSPAIALPAVGNINLCFHYNFAYYNNSSTDDYLRVKVIGNTTVSVFEILGSPTIAEGAWKTYNASLNVFSGQTVYILVEAADDGSASLVEAAIDDVLIYKGSAATWLTYGDKIYCEKGYVGVGMKPTGNARLEVNNNIRILEPGYPDRYTAISPLA